MRRSRAPLTYAIATFALASWATAAYAEAPSAPCTVDAAPNGRWPASFHADAEVDPTAYVFSGFSLHVGLGWKRWRLDVGNYGMKVPEFVHGNSDYDVTFDGYGAKLQYFLTDEQMGGFVGVDWGLNNMYLARKGTDLANKQTQYGVGVDLGWRFGLVGGLYLVPWVGVSYNFNPRDVTLAESTYHSSHWSPFAAIHVGYRFR